MAQSEPVYYIESVDIEDSGEDEDEFQEVRFDEDIVESDTEEDLETALRTLELSSKVENILEVKDVPKPVTTERPEVVDDFIRNFLIRYDMTKTLTAFQREWYQLLQRGVVDQNKLDNLPDCYAQNEELENKVKFYEKEMNAIKAAVSRASTQYIRMRKERNFHRLHHRRLVQEKDKLLNDIKRIKKHYKDYEPAFEELKGKYETAMREKMLTKIECERNTTRIATLKTTISNYENVRASTQQNAPIEQEVVELEDQGSQSAPQHHETQILALEEQKDSKIPAVLETNPNLNKDLQVTSHLTKSGGFHQIKSIKAHDLAISNIALHPHKDIVATVSDDTTWKMWNVEKCELLLTGRGHTLWIGGCDFHPSGEMLATCGGDTTVKVWDFDKEECVVSFKDHSHPVWDVSWHQTGDFLASASMDNTVKLFDLNSERCRFTLRGHTDSVNAVRFLPYSNIITTCSADKSIYLWDIRTNHTVKQLYGHVNTINNINYNTIGTNIASCDAYGVVKIWDLRHGIELATYDFEPHPANYVAFDPSGSCLAVSSNDSTVKMLEVEHSKVTELSGHGDCVSAAEFMYNGDRLISVSSDTLLRIWA